MRVYLSRWRSYRTCPACHGARLRPEALAVRVGDQSIAELSALKIDARFARDSRPEGSNVRFRPVDHRSCLRSGHADSTG